MPNVPKQALAKWLCRVLFCAVLSLALVAMTSGCNSVNWMGDGFHDEFAHWGENQRPPGQPGNLAGLSEQSQEVERDLGVR